MVLKHENRQQHVKIHINSLRLKFSVLQKNTISDRVKKKKKAENANKTTQFTPKIYQVQIVSLRVIKCGGTGRASIDDAFPKHPSSVQILIFQPQIRVFVAFVFLHMLTTMEQR